MLYNNSKNMFLLHFHRNHAIQLTIIPGLFLLHFHWNHAIQLTIISGSVSFAFPSESCFPVNYIRLIATERPTKFTLHITLRKTYLRDMY